MTPEILKSTVATIAIAIMMTQLMINRYTILGIFLGGFISPLVWFAGIIRIGVYLFNKDRA